MGPERCLALEVLRRLPVSFFQNPVHQLARCRQAARQRPFSDHIAQAIKHGVHRNSIGWTGTEGARAGLADSFKAFFVALEEASGRNYGSLPHGFELTDRSVASLLSCALGLDPDQVVDSSYVKRLRQRQRERA
jgi:hypothetical protein